MNSFLGFKLEKRLYESRTWQILAVFIALAIAFVVSSFLIASADAPILQAHRALIRGSVGSPRAIAETLVQATPLIFTGLAVTVAFRARLWNIGGEGQFFVGAMTAYWVSASMIGQPLGLVLLVMVIGAVITGGIWGGIPGYLKARFGASEVIVTVMMNYIIRFVLSFLLDGPWQDPNSAFLQTSRLPENSIIPRFSQIQFLGLGEKLTDFQICNLGGFCDLGLLFQSRLHLGFLLGLLLALVVYILLWKTTIGYEIRAFGINALASKYKGIPTMRTILLVMAISGALAALAGVSELAGLQYRLRHDISTGYGFTGIIVAMLGRLHPAGVILAAIVMGVLVNGTLAMQIETGVPVALAYAIQGIVLVALLTVEVLSRYRIRRVTDE